MRILLGVVLGAAVLAGCSSGSTAPLPGAGTTGAASGSASTPINDNGCGPVEVCGTATVSGSQTLTTQFFSVLSDLNTKKCADWAKGDGKTLQLPIVGNAERTVVFNPIDPITYHDPGTYTADDLLTEAHLQVNGKNYEKAKGRAEVQMADNGKGSITLTDWTLDGEGAPLTLKATWTCTDR
jgi:hypothetical protein